MQPLRTLLAAAAAAIRPEERAHVIVFGSAPLVLAGLKHEEVNDLDLFTSAATFERLSGTLSLDASKSDAPVLRIGAHVEVYKTWLGVTFDEVAAVAVPGPRSWGFPVASLAHVLSYKRAANREKDRQDIELLQRALV